jgi:polysaccharide export outer membrane protein
MTAPVLVRRALLPVFLLAAGCSALPSGGPSTAEMRRGPDVDVVKVNPEAAVTASRAAAAASEARVAAALARLQVAGAETGYRFAPGDVVDVTLWSFSPWPGGGAGGAVGPGAIALGSFTLPADGTIVLPYAGPVSLSGLTLAEAQAAISQRYAVQRILESPTATLRVTAAPSSDILVTGAIGQPKLLPWTPAGLTLAQAVSQSLGDGNAVLGRGDLSRADSAISVTVLRGDAAPVELPMAVALEQRIPLRAGDRVVVRKAPLLEVAVLGVGLRRDGVLGFSKPTVLSSVLAEAAGLDAGVADRRAVFVLRHRADGRPQLYDFAWNRVQGLVAAHQFPMQDGDLVYVAEAPIVSVQKVIGILFQAALPVQALR